MAIKMMVPCICFVHAYFTRQVTMTTGLVMSEINYYFYMQYLANIVVARLSTLGSRCCNNLHCHYMSQITCGLHWPTMACNNFIKNN